LHTVIHLFVYNFEYFCIITIVKVMHMMKHTLLQNMIVEMLKTTKK